MNKNTNEGKEQKLMTKKKKQDKDGSLAAKVKAMLNRGYYTGEIAKALNIPEALVIRIRGDRK